MPECHKCPYDGKPTSACITCKGPSTHPANHGQRFVSLEHMPPKELAKLIIPDPEPEHPMAEFMRTWLHLPNKTRNLLAKVIISQPRSGAALARHRGISRQAVHQRMIKAVRQCPELRTVLRLRLNRQRHDKQGEIFKKIQINTINTGVK